jgi:hypothetical protein
MEYGFGSFIFFSFLFSPNYLFLPHIYHQERNRKLGRNNIKENERIQFDRILGVPKYNTASVSYYKKKKSLFLVSNYKQKQLIFIIFKIYFYRLSYNLIQYHISSLYYCINKLLLMIYL